MDLIDVRSITISDVTQDLILDAYDLGRTVNEFRPLPPEVVQSVQRELLGERVYNSNAIEGNTMTLRETREILRTGAILDVRRKREAQEVLNLGQAIERIGELVCLPGSFANEDEFLGVHRILLHSIDDSIAGFYRNTGAIITGARHQPPDPSEVRPLMTEFFARMSDIEGIDSVLQATWVHWVIARVHPFKDGNGRMARLWQDLVLFHRKLTSAIISQNDKDYYNALEAADEGDFNPFAQLIARRIAGTLQIYLNAQQEADEIKGWAGQLVGETTARLDEKRKAAYIRWTLRMEHLRDAFLRCASQITNASAGAIEIQVQTYPIIDQSTWESLRSGTGAKQLWFFKAVCRRGKLVLRYYFFFGKHFWSEADSELSQIEPTVCLLVSEQKGKEEEAARLDAMEDPGLTIRELLVVDNRLVRKRLDEDQKKLVYDQAIDPVVVAKQFFQEILLRRLV